LVERTPLRCYCIIVLMNAHCFVDGGYLLGISKQYNRPLADPHTLASNITYSELVQYWRTPKSMVSPKEPPKAPNASIGLARTLFYDACPDEVADPEMEQYWKAIELLPDTETRFGAPSRPSAPPERSRRAYSRRYACWRFQWALSSWNFGGR
jgi:hypothetical protein